MKQISIDYTLVVSVAGTKIQEKWEAKTKIHQRTNNAWQASEQAVTLAGYLTRKTITAMNR